MCFRFLAVTLYLSIICLNKDYADTLNFTLQVQRDTLFIGEPIVITKMIENNSKKPVVVFEPGITWNTKIRKLTLRLSTPTNKYYNYGIGVHYYVLWDDIPRCTILPGEQIFSRDMIWWNNFLRDRDIENLPKGEYRLSVSWRLPNYADFESETCRFYAVPLKGEDLKAYKELIKADGYIQCWRASFDRKAMHEASAKALKSKSKLMREYAMFLYGESSEKERRVELLERFIKEFPKSPLTLLARRDIIRSTWNLGGEIKKLLEKLNEKNKEALKEEIKKFQSDYPGYCEFYFRELLRELNK